MGLYTLVHIMPDLHLILHIGAWRLRSLQMHNAGECGPLPRCNLCTLVYFLISFILSFSLDKISVDYNNDRVF